MKQNLPNKQEKEPTKVLSLQEQEALIKEEIQKFLKLAKEKGALTIEEINDLLPPEIIAPAVLDSFMHALEGSGVVITDLSETSKDDEAEGSFLESPDSDDEEVDGPVRLATVS